MYRISFSETSFSCSCPDEVVPCKHLLFLCSLFRHFKITGNVLRINISDLVMGLRLLHPSLHLNPLSNEMCLRQIRGECDICSSSLPTSDVLVCNLCSGLFHCEHLQQFNKCPTCGQFWSPYLSDFIGRYRNLSQFLTRTSYRHTHKNQPPSLVTTVPSVNTNSAEFTFRDLLSSVPQSPTTDLSLLAELRDV